MKIRNVCIWKPPSINGACNWAPLLHCFGYCYYLLRVRVKEVNLRRKRRAKYMCESPWKACWKHYILCLIGVEFMGVGTCKRHKKSVLEK